ncbi:MAG: guanine deaminase [Pseudomonadota bacterium]|nr:guanine deaminase [Pseudomonadota bacterium]
MALLLGRILEISGDPFQDGLDAVTIRTDGAVRIVDGLIADTGDAAALRAAYPNDDITDYGNDLICPGFVDAHVHFPQTAIIASWGKRLIDWLNSYTFPEEMRFGDPDYAAMIAARYFDLTLANGTTTVCSFGTVHPTSVDAFFNAAQTRGLRALTGKTCMDRNAPEGLQDTAQTAYDDSKALLDRWHGVDRLSYVITPRFSPTSTPEQLRALGGLWTERPDCLMQTHLSEQTDEIAWVKSLFPEARDYLDTYEQTGLLGENGLYGHAIHLEPREIDKLSEVNAALIHCPTSNTFIGSGLFDMDGLTSRARVGLATDTGGGSSFSMLRTMAAAYEIGQLRGRPLHPAELMWLATAGSARALKLEDKIGRVAKGYEADLCILNLSSTDAIAQRADRACDAWEEVFATIMMGDDRAVRDVWVNGNRVQR